MRELGRLDALTRTRKSLTPVSMSASSTSVLATTVKVAALLRIERDEESICLCIGLIICLLWVRGDSPHSTPLGASPRAISVSELCQLGTGNKN